MKQRRLFVLAFAFVAVVLAAGCSTTPLPPQTVTAPDQRVTQLHNVALSAGDESRVDPLLMPFGSASVSYKTGEAWKRAFNATPTRADATLKLGASRLEWNIIAAGFAAQIVYTVDAVLSVESREQPLHAQSVRTFFVNAESTIGEAVEEVLSSMSVQIVAAIGTKPQQPTADRLRELSRLLKDGLITQQEFEAKRKALLDQL